VVLVLAIDVCGSIDDNHFKLQREGIAAAERLFATQPLIAGRQVIDVSGYGRQNTAICRRRMQGMLQCRMGR
jgi:hypothetical protein